MVEPSGRVHLPPCIQVSLEGHGGFGYVRILNGVEHRQSGSRTCVEINELVYGDIRKVLGPSD